MFLSYIHSFRAVAILFIVAGHCVYLFEWEGHWIESVLRSVFQNGTVLFVFVAGFLFQHLSGRFEYRRYLKSKLKNVIAPYIVVSIPMLAVQYLTSRSSFDPSRGFEFPTLAHNIAWNYLTGYHILPFWFIPMIVVFYLIAPVLLWMDRARWPYYVMPALFAVAVLAHRPENITQTYHSCITFLPVYIYGMWSSRYRESLMPWVQRLLLPLTALAAALVSVEVFLLDRGGAIVSRLPFSTENGVFDTNALQKILLCWVLMAWLDRYDDQVRGALATLADLSFGIFFLHMYFIQAWAHLLPGENFPHGNLLKYFGLVSVVVGLSVLVILVVKRIFGKRSRMIVGS